MTANHGRSRYMRGCRCDECRQGQADYMRSYLERNPAARDAQARAARRRDRDYQRALARRDSASRQDLTRSRAAAHGTSWTESEDRVALDSTLSATQAAFALGRTMRAVQSRRELLKRRAVAQ